MSSPRTGNDPSALALGLGPGGLVVPVATFAVPQDSSGVSHRCLTSLYDVASYSGTSFKHSCS